MAALPEPKHATVHKIFDARARTADDEHRPHLGASIIGRKCERRLWLTFRWARAEKFPGRVLRLFERGQMEESRWWADLRRIGVQVHEFDPAGNQWRIAFAGGHGGGSMDAAVVGVPEAPKTWHVAEVKTHNAKSFADLEKKGVKASKPEHWAQMQVYMERTGMDRALYCATNKDTDDLYTERVEHDPVEAKRLIARAERIVNAPEPPLRISADPSWYECKLCHFAPLCHGNELPGVNCRTCAHSTPVVVDGADHGLWDCAAHGRQEIPVQWQRSGCDKHRYIPAFLEKVAQQCDVRGDDVVYRTPEGQEFVNGTAPGAMTSAEMLSVNDATRLAFAASCKVELAREGLDPKVVG